MSCASAQDLIEPYLDGELDSSRLAEVREHLETCTSCTAVYSRLQNLQSRIRTQAPYYEAPARLQTRIQSALRQAAKSEAHPRTWARNWIAIAASILLAASLAWNVALVRSRYPSANTIAQEVLSSHLRSLIGTHLLDVPSSDRHTVKPWFNGKLDFSPDVQDFASQGFPLIGGRLEYLDNRPVAALIYQRRQHVINLFIWPTAGSPSGGEVTIKNGFHLIRWTKAGMMYWAVSDLQTSELQQFVKLCGG